MLRQFFIRPEEETYKMANITAKLVKELRDMTGVGMIDAKKALV